MNLSVVADTPFGNEEAFQSFLGVNEIAHIAFAAALSRQGVVISAILPVGDPHADDSWMVDHWQRHMEECKPLGIPVPDLSTVDLNDEGQYTDWMQLHDALHRQQNLKLGITS